MDSLLTTAFLTAFMHFVGVWIPRACTDLLRVAVHGFPCAREWDAGKDAAGAAAATASGSAMNAVTANDELKKNNKSI